MKITVTGLECSGTKWLTALLSQHPEVDEAYHTSIPEYGIPNTRWPCLDGNDVVVWVIRYEPIRLCSLDRMRYNDGRTEDWLPPKVYDKCFELAGRLSKPIVFVGYEALVGPLGTLVFRELLVRIGLDPSRFQFELFNPEDGNAKYFNHPDAS